MALNQQQQKAVHCIEGPLLIVAGAGSGKTRVTTQRIAHMIDRGISPKAILALTFTNKAADEMRSRIKKIARESVAKLTVSTFHAFGLEFIRRNAPLLGYTPRLSVYDTEDSLACLKEVARERNFALEPKKFYEILRLFSDIKTQKTGWPTDSLPFKPLYEDYLAYMKLHNAVDFDDLITLPLALLQKEKAVLAFYQERYRYFLVDEFQDTSLNQYKLLHLLAQKSRNLCCVGDDDQSIYSWRGANYENIRLFETDYPKRREIKLERNYRSTTAILNAANAVITNNQYRKAKSLWTEKQQEEQAVHLLYPADEYQEADLIAQQLLTIKGQQGVSLSQFAILVRTNSLMAPLEEALLAYNIPYVLVGKGSFFQRAEIRDLIAYLKVVNNVSDDLYLLRIINRPRRGIGLKGLALLREISQRESHSRGLYTTIYKEVFDPASTLSKKLHQALAEFVGFIEEFRALLLTEESTLAKTTQLLVESLNYWGFLLAEHSPNEKIAKWKYDNVLLFIKMLKRWESSPDNLEPTLSRWLNRIALSLRDDIGDDQQKEKVHLMTIHASKGLEFDTVFLPGVEQGVLPHTRSAEENRDPEEERRLFYVAMTRAKKRLFLSTCAQRSYRGVTKKAQPSPFLEEIPPHLMVTPEEKSLFDQVSTVSDSFCG